jgi:hypothetical protein
MSPPYRSVEMDGADIIASPPTLLTSTCTLLITPSKRIAWECVWEPQNLDSDIDAKIYECCNMMAGARVIAAERATASNDVV